MSMNFHAFVDTEEGRQQVAFRARNERQARKRLDDMGIGASDLFSDAPMELDFGDCAENDIFNFGDQRNER